MKSRSKLIALFSILWMAMTAGCKKPQSVQYIGLQNFDLPSMVNGKSVLAADVRFFNPNNFNMRLKEVEVDISVNDKYLGHSKLDSLIRIPKNDTFSVPVKVNIDMKALLTNSIIALISNEVDVKIEGRTKIGKGGIYFNVPILYQGKQKLRLFK